MLIPYEQLSESIDPKNQPALDWPEVYGNPDKIPTEIQRIWALNGAVVIEDMLSDEHIEAYLLLRRQCSNVSGFMSNGFSSPVPYMQYKEIRDICLDTKIMQVLESLIGTPCGLHLNLCNLKSTERDWHSDWHLNPAGVDGHYIAVWMALDDIHPDSGPFEFVPTSHRWPIITQQKLWNHLAAEEISRPDWPAIAEKILVPSIEDKIAREGIAPMSFTGKKGSVLFWHSALIHRGSRAKNREMERLGLISHYSSVPIRKEIDMPNVAKWGQSFYFVHNNHPLDAGNPAPTV